MRLLTVRVCVLVVVFVVIGCARSDWIESTLVTADVTGAWSGRPVGPVAAPVVMELILQQAGTLVKGTVTLKGAQNSPPIENAPIQGTINGDLVRLGSVSFYDSFEFVVSGDQMIGGFSSRSGRLTVTLVRMR